MPQFVRCSFNSVEWKLLNRVSGYAKPGIKGLLMSASGAGKTSLLNTLSQSPQMDGLSFGIEFEGGIEYREQLDVHGTAQTFREAMELSAIFPQQASVQKFAKIEYLNIWSLSLAAPTMLLSVLSVSSRRSTQRSESNLRGAQICGNFWMSQRRDFVFAVFFMTALCLYRIVTGFFPALTVGKGPPTRELISGFTGAVRDGEMMPVLGKPGAGCSTFLRRDVHGLGKFIVISSAYYGYNRRAGLITLMKAQDAWKEPIKPSNGLTRVENGPTQLNPNPTNLQPTQPNPRKQGLGLPNEPVGLLKK
ncbi:hypothetical protein B9Z19DRAFT_1126905 [Tuber borchii]|uniref:ABC transporter domain-containing protein n=1 Tax=Tuber borchii TaxID=42251 RepID=A0A2T6ZS55_TUBBO|nr:hypothetical protein B9Z19DRAFT_1126905 [Tuber borchii]